MKCQLITKRNDSKISLSINLPQFPNIGIRLPSLLLCPFPSVYPYHLLLIPTPHPTLPHSYLLHFTHKLTHSTLFAILITPPYSSTPTYSTLHPILLIPPYSHSYILHFTPSPPFLHSYLLHINPTPTYSTFPPILLTPPLPLSYILHLTSIPTLPPHHPPHSNFTLSFPP